MGVDYIWLVHTGIPTAVVLPLLARSYQRWLAAYLPLRSTTIRVKRQLLLVDWLPFSVALLFCYWDRPRLAYTLMAGLVWVTGRFLAHVCDRARFEQTRLTHRVEYVALLFFVSGFSALVYQIVWQRVMYTALGVDSESVTIIVSVFMFGLGIGAMAGSWAIRWKNMLLRLFLGVEISIGVLGVLSIPLAEVLLNTIEVRTKTELVTISYLFFALPTFLMGATLPILIGYLNQRYRNIGRSAGLLYAANTLGSAVAALITVSVIFVFLGKNGAVILAAGLNLVTAGLLYATINSLEDVPPRPEPRVIAVRPIGFGFAAFLALATGFISLSAELLFFKLFGYVSGGKPQVFGWLLASFLAGIAAGSFRINLLSTNGDGSYELSAVLFRAGIVVLGLLLVVSYSAAALGRDFALLAGLALSGVFGYYTGGILPYLGMMATAAGQNNSERRMGLLYVFNIIGAALGPFITGYLVFDHSTMAQVSLGLALALILLALPLAENQRAKLRFLVVGLSALSVGPWLFDGYLERIQYERFTDTRFLDTIENRVSVVTISSDDKGDIVYGGGVYDGRINIDPLLDSNGIQRAFYLGCLHPLPRRVLEIGLSSGSWAKVIASRSDVEELVSVEINPGYLDTLSRNRIVSGVLSHPKIRLVVDDGRKWLRQHPDEKFDAIVSNTTFHWRSNSTNLLSREFLQLMRAHLNPGGVVYYNTTGSSHVDFTAAAVFPHVVRFRSFVAASDSPFSLTKKERIASLLRFTDVDGQPILLSSPEHEKVLHRLAGTDVQDIGNRLRGMTDLRVITDENMVTEYKL